MRVEYLRTLLDYNYWAHRRVWECAASLSPEALTQAHDYSIGSIHAQLVHTMAAEQLWLERLKGNQRATLIGDPALYPTLEAITQHWRSIEQDWRSYLETLSETALDDDVVYISISDGKEHHTPRWMAIMTILNHGTDHRAQILALIHARGGKTVAQDIVFYGWDRLEQSPFTGAPAIPESPR